MGKTWEPICISETYYDRIINNGRNGRGQDFSGLFEIYQRDPHSFKNDVKRVKAWLESGKRRFSLSVAISLVLHVFLISLVAISQSSRHRHSREVGLVDVRPIINALSRIKFEQSSPPVGDRQISPTEEKEITQLLTQTPLFDTRFSEEERTELAKKLMEGYFQLKSGKRPFGMLPKISLADLIELTKEKEEAASGPKQETYSPGRFSDPLGPAFYKIDKRSESQIQFFRRNEKYEKQGTPVQAGMVTVMTNVGKKDVPAEYFFRDCPYNEIIARGAGLFYAIEGFPLLAGKGPTQPSFKRLNEGSSQGFLFKGDLAIYILKTPVPKKQPLPSEKPRPSLQISAELIQKRLDTLMGMPEDLQFGVFIETYLKKYNPDGEGLAKFVREFVYQNLGSVFVVSDSFTSGFDFLEEIFYNKEFQGYFVSYWNENPRTKTGAEFLLTLASLYDFERRAAAYLLDSYEIAKRILSGEEKLPRAFSQKAKAYVLKQVCEDFISRMVARGIKSEDELLSLYRREQERIYQLVMDMGGKERDRALFALGRLCWDEGKHEEAILRWSEISNSFSFKTCQEIKRALTIYDNVSIPVSANLPNLVPRINAIFEWESSENDNLLLKRLMEFHKWKKRRGGL
jgi:hypothetical protein